MKDKKNSKGKSKKISKIKYNMKDKKKSKGKSKKIPEIKLRELKGDINSQLKQVEYAAFFVMFILIGVIFFIIYKLVSNKGKPGDDDTDNETNSQKPVNDKSEKPVNDKSEKPSDEPDNNNGLVPFIPKPEPPTFLSELEKIFTSEVIENIQNWVIFLVVYLFMVLILLLIRRAYRAFTNWYSRAKFAKKLIILSVLSGLATLLSSFFSDNPLITAVLFTVTVYLFLLGLACLIINIAFSKLSKFENLYESENILNEKIESIADFDKDKTNILLELKNKLRDEDADSNEYEKDIENYRSLTDTLKRENRTGLARVFNIGYYFYPSSDKIIEKIENGEVVESNSWFTTFNRYGEGINLAETFKFIDAGRGRQIISDAQAEVINLEDNIEKAKDKVQETFKEVNKTNISEEKYYDALDRNEGNRRVVEASFNKK